MFKALTHSEAESANYISADTALKWTLREFVIQDTEVIVEACFYIT
jgi:hypothetical protein